MYDTDYSPNALTEQQHELLIQGNFQPPPTSAGHLADRMEAGGARIEATLEKLQWSCSTLFFLSGWMIVVGSFLSILSSIFHLAIFNAVMATYLLLFGLVMIVMDLPGAPRWAGTYRSNIRKQARFLTRMTGRSFFGIYLGLALATVTWNPVRGRRSGLFMILNLTMATFVVMVCCSSLVIGLRKSIRLEKVRKQILAAYGGSTNEVFRKYALTDPTHGIQIEEFNRMAGDYTQGRIQFVINDLALIYNAIDEHQKTTINEREFTEWAAGPMTYL